MLAIVLLKTASTLIINLNLIRCRLKRRAHKMHEAPSLENYWGVAGTVGKLCNITSTAVCLFA